MHSQGCFRTKNELKQYGSKMDIYSSELKLKLRQSPQITKLAGKGLIALGFWK